MTRPALASAAGLAGLILLTACDRDLAGTLVPPPVPPAPVPSAADDSFDVAAGSPGVLLDVLANDDAADGGGLLFTALGTPSRGSLLRPGAGVLFYQPLDALSDTTETFTYTVENGAGESATASVTVRIAARILPPEAVDDNFAVDANSGTQALDILANDIANASGELVITQLEPSALGVSVQREDGKALYRPPANLSRSSDSFAYTVRNSAGDTASATVTIEIGPATPLARDDAYAVAPNSAAATLDVLNNDLPMTAGGLRIVEVTAPPLGGSASTDGGSIVYAPRADLSAASERFSYTVENDDGVRAAADVVVTIDAAVPIANPDVATVLPDSGVNEIVVLDNDVPNTGGDLFVVSVSPAALGGTTGTDGTLVRYTPPAGVVDAIDSFEYEIVNADGRQATGSVSVNIATGGVPSLADDLFGVDPGSENDLDVLANDEANSSGGLTLVEVGQPSRGGSALINGGQLRYSPPAGVAGSSEFFTYIAENAEGFRGEALVRVVIAPSAAPEPQPDSFALRKNSPHNRLDVLANDSDPDGDLLSIVFAQANGHGRAWISDDGESVIYQPGVNALAPDSVTYSVSDGFGNPVSTTVSLSFSDFSTEETQLRPCEVEQLARRDAGRPYCFDVLIDNGFDAHPIAATVFVPADGGASRPPVLLHAHGFGESRFASLENPNFVMRNRVTAQALLDLWHEGYWVVTYDQRGFNADVIWGDSAESANDPCMQDGDTGCIDVMNPEREGRDASAVIDWIVANLREGFVALEGVGITPPPPGAAPLFDEDVPGDPVLGTIGLSYGGGWQTIGSAVDLALRGENRIDAMVPVTTWHDLRFSLIPNEVPKTGWIQFLSVATGAGGTTPAPDGFLAQVGQQALALDSVSRDTLDGLLARSVRAYCEGRGDGLIGDGGLMLGAGLAPGPDVFIIQGQRDLLFGLNEALDLAQCYRAVNPDADVRLLVQTEGHILAGIQPASYRDQNSGGEPQIIYIDEQVHCGGASLLTRELIAGWFRARLGAVDLPPQPAVLPRDAADLPAVCFTHFEPEAAPVSGTAFDASEAVPIGDPSGLATFPVNASFTVPGGMQVGDDMNGNLVYSQPLSVPAGRVLAGIPTLDIDITATGAPDDGSGTAVDPPRFFVGIGLSRGGATPAPIADQVTPVSGTTPAPGPDCFPAGCVVEYRYPRDASATTGIAHGEQVGRLAGFSVEIRPGDEVFLLIYAQHRLYNLHATNPGGYDIDVSGSVALPLLP